MKADALDLSADPLCILFVNTDLPPAYRVIRLDFDSDPTESTSERKAETLDDLPYFHSGQHIGNSLKRNISACCWLKPATAVRKPANSREYPSPGYMVC
jgi:hypothetical protein